MKKPLAIRFLRCPSARTCLKEHGASLASEVSMPWSFATRKNHKETSKNTGTCFLSLCSCWCIWPVRHGFCSLRRIKLTGFKGRAIKWFWPIGQSEYPRNEVERAGRYRPEWRLQKRGPSMGEWYERKREVYCAVDYTLDVRAGGVMCSRLQDDGYGLLGRCRFLFSMVLWYSNFILTA